MQIDTLDSRQRQTRWAVFSLLYSAFYFLPLVANIDHFGLSGGIKSTLIYIAFLAIYLQAWLSDGKAIQYKVFALVMLLGWGSYFYLGTSVLYGFPLFLCSWYMTAKQTFAWLLLILVSQVAFVLAFGLDATYFLFPGVVLSVAMTVVGRWNRREWEYQLGEQRSKLEIETLAANVERERIARDLHDSVGHSLATIALKSELLGKRRINYQADEMRKHLDEIAQLSRDTLSEIRQTISGIRTISLDEELIRLEGQLRQHGFDTELLYTPAADGFRMGNDSSLIFILKEATTNIMRHSCGDAVKISITQNDEGVEVLVEDNGHCAQFEAGNGLQGIAQRCEELGGEFAVSNDNGVHLRISLPDIQ